MQNPNIKHAFDEYAEYKLHQELDYLNTSITTSDNIAEQYDHATDSMNYIFNKFLTADVPVLNPIVNLSTVHGLAYYMIYKPINSHPIAQGGRKKEIKSFHQMHCPALNCQVQKSIVVSNSCHIFHTK